MYKYIYIYLYISLSLSLSLSLQFPINWYPYGIPIHIPMGYVSIYIYICVCVNIYVFKNTPSINQTWQWNTPIYTCLSHLNPNLQGDFHHLHGVSHSFPISYRDFPASHVFLIWVFSVAAQLHYTGSAESPRPTTHAQLAIPGPMGL